MTSRSTPHVVRYSVVAWVWWRASRGSTSYVVAYNFNDLELFWQTKLITRAASTSFVLGQNLAIEQIADVAQRGVL